MDTIFQEILVVAAILIAGMAFRTFTHPLVRKLGGIAVLAASYATLYFVFDSHAAGIAGVVFWFLLPWVDLLTRIRAIRLPMEKKLAHRPPPNQNSFPNLREFTDEIEAQGFEYVDDFGWDWDEVKQFFRVFYREEDRMQATISMNEQSNVAFAWVSISSRDTEGICWRTWNYPFGYPMEAPPEVILNRVADVHSFEEMLLRHEEFLQTQGVTEELIAMETPEDMQEAIEGEVRHQVDHNLKLGLITLAGEGKVRYSWRGLFYLWRQFLKDMVKLS